MNLSDLPRGERIFIDANIFLSEIFEEEDTVKSCTKFLNRIKNDEMDGFSSVIVLNEIFHRVAIAQAHESFGISLSRVVTFLKDNPDKFRSMDKPWEAIQNILKIPNLSILEVDVDILTDGLRLSKLYGLLSSDSLHLAVMKAHNIEILHQMILTLNVSTG